IRLFTSYAFITAILVLSAGTAFLTFPLVGQPQVKETAAADGPGIHVEPGAVILQRPSVYYPHTGSSSAAKGRVVLDLTLNSNGEVADARVVSGPQELRQAALQAVLTWRYAAGSPSSVQAAIDFAPSAPNQEVEDLFCHDTSSHGVLKSIDIGKLPVAMQGP